MPKWQKSPSDLMIREARSHFGLKVVVAVNAVKSPSLQTTFLEPLAGTAGAAIVSAEPFFQQSPRTTRSPHLTWVSEGKPRRRLLMVSKKMIFHAVEALFPIRMHNHRARRLAAAASTSGRG